MFPFTSCKQLLFDVKEIVQDGKKTSLNTRDVIIFHDDTRRAKEHDQCNVETNVTFHESLLHSNSVMYTIDRSLVFAISPSLRS